MSRGAAMVVVLAVGVGALATVGCGPGQRSSSRATAGPAPPAQSCRREELARATLSFATESGALIQGSSCPAPARTQLASLAAHYQTSLEALRRITLDDKCGPAGSAQLAPYEEILLAMRSVLTACDASPGAPSPGAPSLDAALTELRDAMALAAEAPDPSAPPTSR